MRGPVQKTCESLRPFIQLWRLRLLVHAGWHHGEAHGLDHGAISGLPLPRLSEKSQSRRCESCSQAKAD